MLHKLSPLARAAVVRALRTAIQIVLPAVAAGLVGVDWRALGLMVGGAVVTSLLTSLLTGLPEVDGAKDTAAPPAQ